LRSVCGVKAPAGNPAIELFAGVVTALLVVRSALSKQRDVGDARADLALDLLAARCGLRRTASGVRDAETAK